MDADNAASAAPPQTLDSWFLDLLACPGCEQRWPLHLAPAQDTLLCACGRYAYPIRDGIPILLLDEATIVNETARPEDVTPEPR